MRQSLFHSINNEQRDPHCSQWDLLIKFDSRKLCIVSLSILLNSCKITGCSSSISLFYIRTWWCSSSLTAKESKQKATLIGALIILCQQQKGQRAVAVLFLPNNRQLQAENKLARLAGFFASKHWTRCAFTVSEHVQWSHYTNPTLQQYRHRT